MENILILLENQRNKKILEKWILKHPKYTSITAEDNQIEKEFDLCIIDQTKLNSYKKELLSIKNENKRVFFPILFLCEENRKVDDQVWNDIDEIIYTPINKEELDNRINNLLERRNLSLEKKKKISKQSEELMILNRILRHDIRNDMDIVINWEEILKEHTDNEGQKYLEKIIKVTHHAVELTKTAGDLVESIVGEKEIEPRPVNLKENDL